MKLATEKRVAGKGNNALRREGQIPAILYGRGQEQMPLSLKKDEFQAILRNIKSGFLATTLFELDGAGCKAVVKEVQYHPVSYDVEHVDFARVSDGEMVEVNVPITLVNVADCAGVKLGGFIRQVVRTIKVRCLPKHIPQEFVIDVRDMDVGASRKLSDISMGAHVQPVTKQLNQVAVAIGKKAGAA
jgi:large subunit ribosomal protein L25